MPPEVPLPTSSKARAVYAFLDRNPNASLADIQGGCGVSHHTAIEHRRAWREHRARLQQLQSSRAPAPGAVS